MVLGFVALRVRGLYLAVATLIFGYMADSYLFAAPWFAGSGGNSSAEVKPIGASNLIPYIDFSDRRTLYLICFGVCALVAFALLNLRDSKSGRAFFAVRGSEMAAASLGIDVRRYKLLAFAVAGGIAGMAGNLTFIGQGTVVSAQFSLNASLLVLSIAVVGGLQSLGGCAAASIVFAGLNELLLPGDGADRLSRRRLRAAARRRAARISGGLAALPDAITTRLLPTVRGWRIAGWVRADVDDIKRIVAGMRGRISRRVFVPAQRRVDGARVRLLQSPPTPIRAPEPAVVTAAPDGEESAVDLHRVTVTNEIAIDVRGVRVEFDGLVAVDDADLTVGSGEIVGLIGPNGAGKTTLFNSISGLVTPTRGSVHILGQDVTKLEVHRRAQLGLGRTFQAIQRFPAVRLRTARRDAHQQPDRNVVAHRAQP